jgi:hypothetical protein
VSCLNDVDSTVTGAIGETQVRIIAVVLFISGLYPCRCASPSFDAGSCPRLRISNLFGFFNEMHCFDLIFEQFASAPPSAPTAAPVFDIATLAVALGLDIAAPPSPSVAPPGAHMRPVAAAAAAAAAEDDRFAATAGIRLSSSDSFRVHGRRGTAPSDFLTPVYRCKAVVAAADATARAPLTADDGLSLPLQLASVLLPVTSPKRAEGDDLDLFASMVGGADDPVVVRCLSLFCSVMLLFDACSKIVSDINMRVFDCQPGPVSGALTT